MDKARIFLADDHPLLRCGLRTLIDAQPDMEVVGEVSDGADLFATVVKLRPDVVVMDLSMSPIGGIEATRRLTTAKSPCKVLVLTVHEDRSYMREVLEAGAVGYMIKRAAPDELIDAIHAIVRGGVFIDARVATKLIDVMVRSKSDKPVIEAPELTPREFEVLRHISEGFSNKEIAAMLEISVKTVETYKARAMEKLGVRSRVDIVRLARERAWPPIQESSVRK